MQITRGKVERAKKVVIYGPEGIGKSTLASKFPEAVFIDTEGSTGAMDVARLPTPSSWEMLLEEVEYVKQHPEVCRTLVIDTIDWAEALCVEAICAAHNKKGIEDFGYGNGYVYVREAFGRLLNKLTEVLDRGVNVVLTAHAQMRKFEQPDEMGAYDRWELKLGKKTSSQTSPLVKEWADMLLFCNYKTMVVNVDGQGATRGRNKAQGGRRVMYTQHHPCWDAKNRFGLPDEIDMDYQQIAHIFHTAASAAQTKTEPIVSQPQAKTTLVDSQSQTKADPIAPLTQTNNAPAEVSHEAPVIQREKREAEAARKTPAPVSEPHQLSMDLAKTGNEHAEGMKDFLFEAPPDGRIITPLQDLMIQNGVSEWVLKQAIYEKGYYPQGTPMGNMDFEVFQAGRLVTYWPQVLEKCKEIQAREAVPFN